jgi:uncharacterized protein YcgI (DUF1989 family)
MAGARQLEVVERFIIPARHGKGFVVKKGQTLRIVEVEGKQVADCTFFNADNHREGYHSGATIAINMLAGTGTLKRVDKLYSRPPYENVMLTVTDDPVGLHFAWMGGRCTRRIYEIRNEQGIGQYVDPEGHRTCQGNLEEAIAPFGLAPDEVPDIFNVFMNNDDRYTLEHHRLSFLPPVTEIGDYIDLRAEMNILAAISACPNDQDAVNDGVPKPLEIRILE